MRILFVTATANEAEALKKVEGIDLQNGIFRFKSHEINLLVTGVGAVPAAWHISDRISKDGLPDFAMNCGIAGSFRDNIMNGDVVMPVSECFADYGIEDHDSFYTLFEAGLSDANEFPFSEGKIKNDENIVSKFGFLNPVNSITIGAASGSSATIERLRRKYNPDIETMEGASFFYICKRERIPFLAIRAVSNRIEPRDRSKWNIALAIDNLAEKLRDVFLTLDLSK